MTDGVWTRKLREILATGVAPSSRLAGLDMLLRADAAHAFMSAEVRAGVQVEFDKLSAPITGFIEKVGDKS